MSPFKKKLLLLLAATALLRGMAAASIPMLAVDAYYWLWGQYPAAGYFDHPPMTGLMQWLFLSGIHGLPLAARSAPIVLGLAAIAALYGFVRHLYDSERLAWRAAALFALMPIFIAMGVSVEPDNSLILFMILTWWSFWRALNTERPLGWWLLAGALAGCALLSKFHAWILLPPLWGFLLISPAYRPRLKTAGPWLALAVTLAVLSPNLLWNARHDWMNYAFQWHRSGLPGSRIHVSYIGIFLGGAIASLTPLVFAGVLTSAGRALGNLLNKSPRDDRALFLLCAGLPLPVFLGMLSFAVKISLHWPSCGYIPLMVLMLARMEEGRLWGPRLRKVMWGSAAAIAVVLYLVPPALGLTRFLPRDPDGGGRMISLTRLRVKMSGLPELGTIVGGRLEAANKNAPTVIMAPDWHLTALLAFYTQHPRDCFALDETDAHNFRLWMADRGNLKGNDAIVVIEKSDPNRIHSRLSKKYDKYLRYLQPMFVSVEPLPSFVIFEDGSMTQALDVSTEPPRLREFLLFHCRGFKGELNKNEDD